LSAGRVFGENFIHQKPFGTSGDFNRQAPVPYPRNFEIRTSFKYCPGINCTSWILIVSYFVKKYIPFIAALRTRANLECSC
jgi:hypothetical protein